MQTNTISKFCFGLGLATIAAKGLIIWSMERFYSEADSLLEQSPAEVFDPAINLVSAVALIGLVGAAVALAKGGRGQLLYAALVLNGVALLVNPMG